MRFFNFSRIEAFILVKIVLKFHTTLSISYGENKREAVALRTASLVY